MIRQYQRVLAFAWFLVVAAMLIAAPPLARAQVDEWNLELTREIYAEMGHTRDHGSETTYLMRLEALSESERFKKSGVTYLEKHKRLEGMNLGPHANIAELYESVSLPRPLNPNNPDGSPDVTSRQLHPEEARRVREQNGMPPEQLEAMMDGMAGALLLLGEAFQKEASDAGLGAMVGDISLTKLSNASLNSGELEAQSDDQNRSRMLLACSVAMDNGLLKKDHTFIAGVYEVDGRIHPGLYVMGPACMLLLSAEQLRNFDPEDPQAYAKAQQKAAEEAARYASIGGTETLDGQETVRIDLKGLGMSEVLEDGREMEVDSISIWIDREYLKRRKFRMEGIATERGKSQRFFIERENQDYRRVDDSYLYEPYLEIFRVGGVLSDKDRKELAKAQKELEKAEKQLAAMPASQRAMMERMMGSQMEQLRSMARDGSMEVRVITTDIVINPDFSAGPATVSFVGGAGANASLVRLIQANLATLGYEPGPATGELDQLTQIAISQFQAERGLEVTGKPSEPLARMLQEEVDAR